MIRVTLMPHAPILLVATSVNVTLDSLAVESLVQVGWGTLFSQKIKLANF